MKKTKIILRIALVLLMAALALGLASCKNGKQPEQTDANSVQQNSCEMLGHTYSTSNTCDRCGYTIPVTEGLEIWAYFNNYGDSLYQVHSIGEATATEIYIPAVYNGSKVVVIDTSAFDKCTSLTAVHIPDGVEYIKTGAFSSCTGLTTVNIPKSVVSVAEGAFDGCTKLLQNEGGALYADKWVVDFDGSSTMLMLREGTEGIADKAFEKAAVTGVKLSAGVKAIGKEAFAEAKSLKNFEIPASVEYVGTDAFKDCDALFQKEGNVRYVDKWAVGIYEGATTAVLRANTVGISNGGFSGAEKLAEVTLPESMLYLGSAAFKNCKALKRINIPSGITEIKNDTFAGCEALENITIPENVTALDAGAFENCDALTDVTIPNSVTRMGYYVFNDCDALKSIKLSDNLTWIGQNSFYECDKLESVMIPEGVTYIGEMAFSKCSSLREISIPSTVTKICVDALKRSNSLEKITIAENNPVYHAAGNCIIETATKTLYIGCTSSVIPDDGSVTSIASYAFHEAADLENRRNNSLTIPKAVKKIETDAFKSCSAFWTITVDGCEEIGNYAFNSASFETVIINEGTKTIGEGAFVACRDLVNVEMPETLESIGAGAFYKTKVRNIVIPDSVKTIGQSAFRECYNLRTLTIGKNLTKIEKCLEACFYLEKIVFNGTEAEWNKIEKAENWDIDVGRESDKDFTLEFKEVE